MVQLEERDATVAALQSEISRVENENTLVDDALLVSVQL